jgi:hypothetical protein
MSGIVPPPNFVGLGIAITSYRNQIFVSVASDTGLFVIYYFFFFLKKIFFYPNKTAVMTDPAGLLALITADLRAAAKEANKIK